MKLHRLHAIVLFRIQGVVIELLDLIDSYLSLKLGRREGDDEIFDGYFAEALVIELIEERTPLLRMTRRKTQIDCCKWNKFAGEHVRMVSIDKMFDSPRKELRILRCSRSSRSTRNHRYRNFDRPNTAKQKKALDEKYSSQIGFKQRLII